MRFSFQLQSAFTCSALLSYFSCKASVAAGVSVGYDIHQEESQANFAAMRSNDISFFIREVNLDNFAACAEIQEALRNHEARVYVEQEARFVFECLRGRLSSVIDTFPPRTPKRPYLLFAYENPEIEHIGLLKKRPDILYVGCDLRPFGNDTAAPLNGITFAPPGFFRAPATLASLSHYDVTKPSKYFLTFRGAIDHPARASLMLAFQKDGVQLPHGEIGDRAHRFKLNWTRPLVSGDLRESSADVQMEFLSANNGFDTLFTHGPRMLMRTEQHTLHSLRSSVGTRSQTTDGLDSRYNEHYSLLFNSSYVLVPRGEARWTHRFSEVVTACTVPVLLADGVTLPYEELIDWRLASIRVPEISMRNGTSNLMKLLPTDPVVISNMRREVCRLSKTYFDSMQKRADAMLRAAAIKSGPLP